MKVCEGGKLRRSHSVMQGVNGELVGCYRGSCTRACVEGGVSSARNCRTDVAGSLRDHKFWKSARMSSRSTSLQSRMACLLEDRSAVR